MRDYSIQKYTSVVLNSSRLDRGINKSEYVGKEQYPRIYNFWAVSKKFSSDVLFYLSFSVGGPCEKDWLILNKRGISDEDVILELPIWQKQASLLPVMIVDSLITLIRAMIHNYFSRSSFIQTNGSPNEILHLEVFLFFVHFVDDF